MTPTHEPPQRMQKTQWHRLLGKHLELLLTPVGITVQTEPQVMSEPPKVDILLLRREGTAWTPVQTSLLPDGIRQSQAGHILLEFKFTESVNGQVMQQVIGYDYFYRQAQQVAAADVQSFIVSSRKPRSHVLLTYGYRPSSDQGIYHSANPLLHHIPLLVLNELAFVQHNAFIQCFASQRRIREQAFRLLAQMDWQTVSDAFWDFFTGLRTTMTVKGVTMDNEIVSNVLTPEVVMETGKQMRKALLANLTPQEIQQLLANNEQIRKQILASTSSEERLAGISPEERLVGIPAEERLAGIPPEERLAGLTTVELASLLHQIEAYLRTHPTDSNN